MDIFWFIWNVSFTYFKKLNLIMRILKNHKEIEEALSESVTDGKTKELIPDFMKKLKEVDPFAIGSWEQKSYALKFLNVTTINF